MHKQFRWPRRDIPEKGISICQSLQACLLKVDSGMARLVPWAHRLGVRSSRALMLGSQCPLDPCDTLLLVEFLVPVPTPWENHLSTELTTETILSLEYGGLVRVGSAEPLNILLLPTPEPSPISVIRPRSRWTKTPTSVSLICSRSFRSAPADTRVTAMTWHWIPGCQRIQQWKPEEKQPERKEKHQENSAREAREGRGWSKKDTTTTTTKR